MRDLVLPSTWVVILRLLGSYFVGVLIASFLVSLLGAGELFVFYLTGGLVFGLPGFLPIALFVVAFKGFVHRHLNVLAILIPIITAPAMMAVTYASTYADRMSLEQYLSYNVAWETGAIVLLGAGIAAYTFVSVSRPRR